MTNTMGPSPGRYGGGRNGGWRKSDNASYGNRNIEDMTDRSSNKRNHSNDEKEGNKKGKEQTGVILDTRNKDTEMMATEKMRARGENMIAEESGYKTNVKFEWPMKENQKVFKVRDAMIEVLKTMKVFDPQLYIESTTTEEAWKEMDEIPKGEEFTKAFAVKNVEFGRGKTHVYVFVTINSKYRLNTIKFEPRVYLYLQKNEVYIKVDMFKRNITASPGQIIGVHPKMVRKDDLVEEIMKKIESKGLPQNEIIDSWVEANHSEDEVVNALKFKIVVAEEKYGNDKGRVEATTLKILCARKDGLALKTIMADVWKSENKPRGIFVPAWTDLITNPQTYKQILRNHNAYVNMVTSIPIKGVSKEAMEGKVGMNETLKGRLESHVNIESMEQTGYTEEKGRWLIIVKKEKYEEVFNFVQAELKYTEAKFETEEKLGKPQPLRGNSKAKEAIGTYTEVLQGFSNPQDDQETLTVKGRTYNLTENPLKRKKVVLSTQEAEGSDQQTEASTITTEPPAEAIQKKVDTFKEEVLKQQEETFQKFCEELTASVDRKINEMFERLQKDILESVTRVIQESIGKITIPTLNNHKVHSGLVSASISPDKNPEPNNDHTRNPSGVAQRHHV